MKKTLLLAVATLALGACSHRPTRNAQAPAPAPAIDQQAQNLPPGDIQPPADTTATDDTASGSSTSLGAVSSGRGH